MTFARHLALRGATRALRPRSAFKLSRHSFASDKPGVSAAEDATYLNSENYSSLSARHQDGHANDLIQSYYNRNTILHTTQTLGSNVEPHYKPNDLYMNPPAPAEVSVELLLASQTHLGHSTSLWHPANSRYIFGVREGIHIISLDVTAAYLRRAAKVVSGVAERGGIILFVGSRKGHERAVVRTAELAGACHLFEQWIPGTITNGQQILGRCTSKVVDEFDNEVKGFKGQLAELPVLQPDLIVCLNPLENYVMLHECGLANIPTIGIIDTDTNPTWVTYPIPANDDSLRSVALIAGVLGRAGQHGQAARLKAAQDGKVTYLPPQRLKWRTKEENDMVVKDEDALDPNDSGPELRMGQGSNFFEAGLSPRGGGTPLGSRIAPIGFDDVPPEEVASSETKATPGKEVGWATDRDLGTPVNSNAAVNPLTADPAGFQDKPSPARELKREDKTMEEGDSQVR